jgi:hypothetical protein
MASPISMQEELQIDSVPDEGESNKVLNEILVRLERRAECNRYYYDSLLKIGDTPDHLLKDYGPAFLTLRKGQLREADYEQLIADLVRYRGDIRPWCHGHCIGCIHSCDEVLKKIECDHASMERQKKKPLQSRKESTARTLQTIHDGLQHRIHCYETIMEYTRDPQQVKYNRKNILDKLRPFTKRVQLNKFATTLKNFDNEKDTTSDFVGYISGSLNMSNFIFSLLDLKNQK